MANINVDYKEHVFYNFTDNLIVLSIIVYQHDFSYIIFII